MKPSGIDHNLSVEHSAKLHAGTPLRIATINKNRSAVEAILALGANPYDGGESQHPPIFEACFNHMSDILELFLPPNYDIIHPGWYKKPFFRAWDMIEMVPEMLSPTKSKVLAMPKTWARRMEQGWDKSLLGYALYPRLLHERMIIHGRDWRDQMKRTIDLILELGEEDHLRVSPTNCSSILEAVRGGDADIVSYILDKVPETRRLLAAPHVTGHSTRLPIHSAILHKNRPVFDILLEAAGPNQQLVPPSENGMVNWFKSKLLEWGGATISTCTPSHKFSTFLHFCASATLDPYFARIMLEGASDSATLISTKGRFGELPLTSAVINQSFELADLLIALGASIHHGGRPAPSLR
jgi:ankyrin repeat protein